MATDNEQAQFSLVFDDQVSGGAESAADSVEALRARLESGESAVKQMSAALRRLKGSTDEVKTAKEQLKARIGAEKDAISAAQLAMLKAGASTDKLTAKTKDLTKEKGKASKQATSLGAAVKSAGGSVASMKGQLESAGGATGLLVTGMTGLVSVCLAVAAAVGAAFVALGKFVVQGANAARSASLMREAFGGSAKNGVALGTQIDALARKVPTSKAALDELAGSLLKSGLGGQTFVDSLNAISQANAALGDDAGGKLRSILERGKVIGNFSIQGTGNGWDELQGTGIQRDDVAAELARNMSISVDKARAALAEGRVKLEDGAKAMREAVERKFGGLNLRKMLDLNVMAEKIRERLASLTEDVNLEPLLKGAKKLFDIFDDTTVTGDALKKMVTVFGSGLATAAEKSAPVVKKFFQGMIIATLQVGIVVLQLRNRLRTTFGDSQLLKNINVLNLSLTAGKYALYAIVAALGVLTGLAATAVAPFVALWGIFVGLPALGEEFGKSIRRTFLETDWKALGVNIVDGLLNGLKDGATKLVSGAKSLADSVKGGFKSALGIQSPSKVFQGYGENTVEGFERGIEARTPEAAKSLDAMAAPPEGGPARGRGPVTINLGGITINVSGGADAAKQVTEPGFLRDLTKALEVALLSSGIPVR